MGYYDTKQKIVNSLLGRPDGTQIQPDNHQDFALSLLEYIRSVELISGSTLIGIANVTTVPVQSDDANECYVSACPVGAVLTYENFHGQDGNPITYSADQNSGALLLLLWNKQYWELVDFPTTIQVTAEIINYASSIRKTYASKEAMEADTNPFGDDGKAIVPGQLVTVVNSTDTTYNGIYARTQNGNWKFQSGFNWSLVQNIGDDANTAMSQKAVTDELNLIHTKIEALKNSGYLFAGIATPATNPGTPDGPVFYLASESGTYTNFNAIELQEGLSVLMWNGSWSSQQILSIDDAPTAGSDNLVKSGGVQQELALGAVYDVSAKNPTAGTNNDGKFESLSALLSDANLNTLIPTAVRKGGMSIKFVQSSDNKYIQYRLTTDEWSIDTEDWAIADEGVYVENPEFVYVKTDNEDKILYGVKTDGNFYFSAGCPQQVKDYIEEIISSLSLDEYEDIVAFLNGLEEGDKTLQTLLNEKVDKEEGKSLIDSEYASTKSTIDNPEFLEVTTDLEDKVLEGIQADGTKVIGGDLNVGGSANLNGDLRVLGNMEVSGVSYNVIENSEYLAAWLDAEDKVIFGLKADGKTYVGDAEFLNDIDNIKAFLQNITDKNIDWDALSSIAVTDNPEYIDIKIDSENKILEGITADGVKHINIPVDNGVAIIETTDNPEFLEAKVDAEGKLIEGINKNGEKIFGVIPPQIKQYIDDNMPAGGSGVQSIEYDEETGDMYATYDDEGGITDVYMEPDGGIYVEYEE